MNAFQVHSENEDCGKRIKKTKKKLYWKFGLDSTANEAKTYEIAMIHSFLSGKKVIYLDNNMIHSSTTSKPDFHFSFTIASSLITITFSETTSHTLAIDGRLFRDLPFYIPPGAKEYMGTREGPSKSTYKAEHAHAMSAMESLDQDFELALKIQEEEERSHREAMDQHDTDEELARKMQMQFDQEEEEHARRMSVTGGLVDEEPFVAAGTPHIITMEDTNGVKHENGTDDNTVGDGKGGDVGDLLLLDDDNGDDVRVTTKNSFDPFSNRSNGESSNEASERVSTTHDSHILNESTDKPDDPFGNVIQFTCNMSSADTVLPPAPPTLTATSSSVSTLSTYDELDEPPTLQVDQATQRQQQRRKSVGKKKPAGMKPPLTSPIQPTLVPMTVLTTNSDARGNLSALDEIFTEPATKSKTPQQQKHQTAAEDPFNFTDLNPFAN